MLQFDDGRVGAFDVSIPTGNSWPPLTSIRNSSDRFPSHPLSSGSVQPSTFGSFRTDLPTFVLNLEIVNTPIGCRFP
jgi:hypothetical protein